MNNFKRVAAIHDLSGVGRCSLTVIIPILSSMGVQCCPVPTAILSTHTGGFNDVVIRDLSDYIIPAMNQYKKLNLQFSCVYTGFLANEGQVDHCNEFMNKFAGENVLRVVDPVMGDHGRTYKTCTRELCSKMIELVKNADIILPNLTEAAILLDEKYPHGTLTNSEIKSWLVRLCKKGPKTVIITSVPLADGTICNVGYDSFSSNFWKVKCNFVPVHYPGSGDIFSSVVVGGLLKGDSLPIAINRATSFAEYAIKTTYSYSTDPREGIMLEACLGWLTGNEILGDYTVL